LRAHFPLDKTIDVVVNVCRHPMTEVASFPVCAFSENNRQVQNGLIAICVILRDLHQLHDSQYIKTNLAKTQKFLKL
jgi:hypothetical protein